jgi:hypothetical protein
MKKSSSTEDSESHQPQPQPQPQPPPTMFNAVPNDVTGAVDSETSTSVDVERIEQLTDAQNPQRLTVSQEAKSLVFFLYLCNRISKFVFDRCLGVI